MSIWCRWSGVVSVASVWVLLVTATADARVAAPDAHWRRHRFPVGSILAGSIGLGALRRTPPPQAQGVEVTQTRSDFCRACDLCSLDPGAAVARYDVTLIDGAKSLTFPICAPLTLDSPSALPVERIQAEIDFYSAMPALVDAVEYDPHCPPIMPFIARASLVLGAKLRRFMHGGRRI